MESLIVVADTHFGIRKNAVSMPIHLADFMSHLRKIQEQPVKIYNGAVARRVLQKPSKIIFLGDILELWDSEDEAVSSCVVSLLPTVSEIEAEKIYVLGNHDNILKKAMLSGSEDSYPLGESKVKIFENVYPPQSFLEIGSHNYVFLHGHQFNKCFKTMGRFYWILPEIRKLSNSLTLFVPRLFGLSLIIRTAQIVMEHILPSEINISSSVFIVNFFLGILKWVVRKTMLLGEPEIVVLLFFLTLPRLYMVAARPFWEWISGVKYKEEKAINNFTKWWKEFINGKEIPKNVNVIYGHTHFLNYVDLQNNEYRIGNEMYDFYAKKLGKRATGKEEPVLVNLSAWVKDTRDKLKEEKYKNVMVASFLYIDEQGFEFFGWDWYSKQIFHIPKRVIVERRKNGCVCQEMEGVLRDLGWPEELIRKWRIYFTLNRPMWKRLIKSIKALFLRLFPNK